MKALSVVALAALLTATACNGEKAATGANAAAAAADFKAVAPPANGDWSEVVSATPAGGFVMGNPNAKVKLVEYGSMTCPHCASFEKIGGQPLVDNYVKKGLVSWEFRNYVRDPYDITASLVARCGGPSSFFGMTRAFYAAQPEWIGKIQAASPDQMQALQNMGPQQQFAAIADIADFPEFAAMRGVPKAKVAACLANEAEATKLVQMNSDAMSQYPDFPGTPTFLIGGSMVNLGAVTEAEVWPALEKKIQEALKG